MNTFVSMETDCFFKNLQNPLIEFIRLLFFTLFRKYDMVSDSPYHKLPFSNSLPRMLVSRIAFQLSIKTNQMFCSGIWISIWNFSQVNKTEEKTWMKERKNGKLYFRLFRMRHSWAVRRFFTGNIEIVMIR